MTLPKESPYILHFRKILRNILKLKRRKYTTNCNFKKYIFKENVKNLYISSLLSIYQLDTMVFFKVGRVTYRTNFKKPNEINGFINYLIREVDLEEIGTFGKPNKRYSYIHLSKIIELEYFQALNKIMKEKREFPFLFKQADRRRYKIVKGVHLRSYNDSVRYLNLEEYFYNEIEKIYFDLVNSEKQMMQVKEMCKIDKSAIQKKLESLKEESIEYRVARLKELRENR